jgi:hypothetical protein
MVDFRALRLGVAPWTASGSTGETAETASAAARGMIPATVAELRMEAFCWRARRP